MHDYIKEIWKDDLKYGLLKELAENQTVSYDKLNERYGRKNLDLLEARKFIIRIFVKRGNHIWSFYKLSEDGSEVYFTVKGIRGD